MTVIQTEDKDRARSLEIEREGLEKTEQGEKLLMEAANMLYAEVALVVRAAAIFAATCLAGRTGVARVQQAPVVFASRSGSLSG